MLVFPLLASATILFSLFVSISGNTEYLIINPSANRTAAVQAYGTITLFINSSNTPFLVASSIKGICLNNSLSVGFNIAAAKSNGAIIPAVLLQTPMILIL